MAPADLRVIAWVRLAVARIVGLLPWRLLPARLRPLAPATSAELAAARLPAEERRAALATLCAARAEVDAVAAELSRAL